MRGKLVSTLGAHDVCGDNGISRQSEKYSFNSEESMKGKVEVLEPSTHLHRMILW